VSKDILGTRTTVATQQNGGGCVGGSRPLHVTDVHYLYPAHSLYRLDLLMNSPDIYSDVSANGGEHTSRTNNSTYFENKPGQTDSQPLTDNPNVVDMGHSDIELRVSKVLYRLRCILNSTNNVSPG
jgi:hypothetical protein